ncbi:MAG: response regulator, partial [Gammaproteobacteria bacterium]|nr:response regulator [Gammaproteobacteria bacterium]
DEVLRLLNAVLPASIEITHRCEPDLPTIALDAVEFHQLVMNLAINARDALGGEGRLEFDLARMHVDSATCSACGHAFEGDFVVLGVSDDGPGIGTADPAEIFLPFYTTKAVDEGTGLGLAMVHGIMHRAGGHILLDSRPGLGTRFQLLFPVEGALPTVAAIAAPGTTQQAPRPARIIVVDDEPALQLLWRDLLEGAGYVVDAYGDGAAALAAFDAAPDTVDAMVLDMTMPVLSGDSLARAVLERRPELPVFICTGHSDKLDGLLALGIGIRGVFSKPIDFDEVLAHIAAALATSR